MVAGWEGDLIYQQHLRTDERLGRSRGRRMAATVDCERTEAGVAGVVAGWEVDCISERQGRGRVVGHLPGQSEIRRSEECDDVFAERRGATGMVARWKADRVPDTTQG